MSVFLPFEHPRDVPTILCNRIIAGTGHRPQKLDGYSEHDRRLLTHVAVDWLSALKPRGIISGLAQGWDSALIEACWELNLPYVTCAPFKSQSSKWPIDARRRYELYIERAARHFVCSAGEFTAAKMQIRNERMIDLALKDGPDHGLLLALWDGSAGGTRNCIAYAHSRRLAAINTWNNFRSYRQ